MRFLSAPAVGAILLLALVSPPAHAARELAASGPIDRLPNQEDTFCPSEISVMPGDFVADGPEMTVEFRARNLGFELPAGPPVLWMFTAIDAVSVLERTIHDLHATALPCLDCDPGGTGTALAWDQVPPGDFTYFESFAAGIPPEWFAGDGLWQNGVVDDLDRTSSNTPSDSVDCVGDRTGFSLGLGESTDPAELVSTRATVPGLTEGEEYVLSFWWHARPDSDATNGDLDVTIWGEEPWEELPFTVAGENTTTWAAAWADVDGDGWEDVYLGRGLTSTPKNLLLRNMAGAGFADVTPPVLDDPGDAAAASWADVDNDGDPDLFLANWDASGNRLFRNDGNFAFVDVTPESMNPSATAWVAAWSDYDLDGDLDVYVLRHSDVNSLYRNDGAYQFEDVATGELIGGPSTQGVAWGDVDDDGDPDLYIARRNNFENKLLRNDGGTFVDVATGAAADNGPGRDAAFADFDNDGDLDLAVINYDGEDRLLENLGGGAYIDATPAALAGTTASISVTWQDVELDGDLDLLVAREGRNSLLLNEGGGNWTESIGGPFPRTDAQTSTGGTFSDVDNDGDVDLLVTNRMGGSDRLFRNDDGGANHWLAVELLASLGEPSGVGARIDVTAGGVTQRRDVGFDVPLSSRGTLRAHFGFGATATIDAITVHWPSGLTQDYPPPPVDQPIVLVEGDPTGVLVSADLPDAFSLGRPAPNPFGAASTIPFAVPRRSRVRVEVFDVLGRRVATLVDRVLEPGAGEARWDARDSEGLRAASGIYFVRLQADGWTGSRKVTLR
jgi:hypothetical protein